MLDMAELNTCDVSQLMDCLNVLNSIGTGDEVPVATTAALWGAD